MRMEKKWYIDELARRTVEALKKNGFDAFYVSTKEEALDKILQLIPEKSKVGIPGSVTLREIGIVESLIEKGYDVAENWLKKYSPEEDLEIRKKHLTSDVLLTSSNAVTEDGKLVNIDGAGNRVAAMIFGPKKVIIAVGVNKIVKDVFDGIERVRNTAAPMNVKRVGGNTPCYLNGDCDLEECKPPDRHCHIISIIEKKPMKTDTTIVMVGEDLGF